MTSCGLCEQVFDRGRTPDIKIQCKLCKNVFHQSCVKVTPSELKTINNAQNICWFCDNCVPKIALYDSVLNKIDEIISAVKINSERLEKHEQILNRIEKCNSFRVKVNATANETPTQKRRFADVVASCADDRHSDGNGVSDLVRANNTERTIPDNNSAKRPRVTTNKFTVPNEPVIIVSTADEGNKKQLL